MSKTINFIDVYYPYNNIINRFIEPIAKYLPNWSKSFEYKPDCINVSFFYEEKQNKDIFISHGLADKNWRDAHFVKDYDYICVSGKLWKEKMIGQGIPSEKILVNGYSKLDPLFNNKDKKQRIDNMVLVLFAPTHNIIEDSENISIYNKIDICFEEIPNNIEIIKSWHPANDWNNMTYDQLLLADVVISDCSSVIYEAWALDIPVVFPDWIVKDFIIEKYPNSFEEYIYINKIGYHATNSKELLEMIYLAKKDGLDNETKSFIDGIFPKELRGKSGEVTAKLLLDIAEKEK